ncbi:hypothetical protein AMR42_15615 [Limnothrix sp. PR1529]|uniref:hypothetical protein n=1 Tax=Limnothrix sp. PR1529 TaxID=1704291 RepID=UPI00081F3EE8|nr:hypothetical protein [Limnothrix sp. PR1529]OCQ92191.1 hypothetical protein BCR12_18660 [Limnothrix sp. P13C2]PIB05634.1 hypothetical protein AMR42_15615 [Limnothrix sp. PR1529]
MNDLKIDDLRSLSLGDRAALIDSYAKSITVPPQIKPSLQTTYQRATAIKPLLLDYCREQITADRQSNSVLDRQNQSEAIAQKCHAFAQQFIDSIPSLVRSPRQAAENPKNLYELCGATLFTASNAISRSLSTKMGQLWEDLAKISPYTISPEKDFGIKITGIDIIIFEVGQTNPIFTQLKTTPGTLTGSQKPRSQEELAIHEFSLFAAAFCLGTWNFSSPTIPRACGQKFWSKIGIEYELVEDSIKTMILDIEAAYLAFQNGQ